MELIRGEQPEINSHVWDLNDSPELGYTYSDTRITKEDFYKEYLVFPIMAIAGVCVFTSFVYRWTIGCVQEKEWLHLYWCLFSISLLKQPLL